MKTMLVGLGVLVALSAQGMVTEIPAITDSPITKKGDTTIIEVGGSRVVVIEGDDKDDVDVRIENAETGEEKEVGKMDLFGDKDKKVELIDIIMQNV